MSYIPPNHNHVSPYLILERGEPVVRFLKEVLDGEETMRVMDEDGRIVHVEITIKDSVIMLGEGGGKFTPTRTHIHIYVEDVDVTFKKAVEKADELGLTVINEPQDQPDGDRRGTVEDNQGNGWTFATRTNVKN